jgi:HlyD family secretion protein
MKKIALTAILALALLITSACGTADNQGTAAAPPAPVQNSDSSIAEAKVVPARSAALSWSSGGTVAEVLVAEGDSVKSGQVLVRLDSAHQRTNLAAARARLEQAQASYQNLIAGVRPEQIAAAEAQLRQTQAQLRQARASVSADDLRAARAQLEQSQAQLARLQAGARETDLRASDAQLEQAQAQLATQRDQLSANKTNAKLQLDQAADRLRQAQTSYSTARWNWQHVEAHGTDPLNPKVTDPATGKSRATKLNDAQKQQYRDALTQAEITLHSAESAVQQAQVAYDTARQNEVSGIQAAEQQLSATQANHDQVRAGPETDQLAAARAQLASAQANLGALTGETRAAALDTAQAAVEATQAQLALLKAGAPESELILARAQVQSAQAELAQAQLALDETELRAPFDGLVAALELKANEYIGPGAPVVRLADVSTWQIESTDLTELSVVNVYEGAPVTISFDAIPGLELPGKVTRVKSFGESKQGDITYTVTVTPNQQDQRLRWNMTAKLAIEPAR